MGNRTKIICERGKFFIETGSSRSFHTFLRGSAESIIKYTSAILILRIIELMDSGNKDAAVSLWTTVCKVADPIPSRNKRLFIFLISYVTFAVMATFAFIHTLFFV